MNNNIESHHQSFEDLKQSSDTEEEFWFARDLQIVLGYASWDKFERVIHKAMTAAINSEQSKNDHFSQVGKMVCLRIFLCWIRALSRLKNRLSI